MHSVSIITLGCKQNKYESDCMAQIIEDATLDDLDADDLKEKINETKNWVSLK